MTWQQLGLAHAGVRARRRRHGQSGARTADRRPRYPIGAAQSGTRPPCPASWYPDTPRVTHSVTWVDGFRTGSNYYE
eukprot:SAG31_NODE_2667_length_5273_cov_2.316776_3_plen_77_part_00